MGWARLSRLSEPPACKRKHDVRPFSCQTQRCRTVSHRQSKCSALKRLLMSMLPQIPREKRSISATKFDGSRNCGTHSNPARSLAQFELVHLSEFVKAGPSKLIGFVPYCTGTWRAQPFCRIRLEACGLAAHE